MGAKGERQQSRRQRQAEKEFMDDQIYHERLMVLDAAEEGFFQRGGERVFIDRLEEPHQDGYNEFDDDQDHTEFVE